jgi:hypothetical protein
MGSTFSRHAWRGRWVMTGALVLLALGVTTIAAQILPRSYQSEGSMVLLASRAAAKPNGNNPYLSFTPSLTLTADVLSRELTAPATVGYLASRGYPGSYTVALAPETATTTGSVLLLTVTGGDQATVGHTLLAVIDEIRIRLARLQAGIARYDQIRVVPLSVSQQAAVSVSATLKPLIVILVLCLAAAFGIPWIVDAQLAERRRHPDAGSTAVLPPLARHGANGGTFIAREVSHETAPPGPSRPRSRGR